MEARYGADAARTSSIIVPMCGFDSVPSDLGALLAVRHARRALGARCAAVDTYVEMHGGVSGGTIATGRATAADAALAAATREPLLLVPAAAAARVAPLRDGARGAHWVAPLGRYGTHNVMAVLNTRVVRRSAALFAQRGAEAEYSSPAAPFAYSEYSCARTWLGAMGGEAGGALLGALLFRPWFFPLVRGLLPAPGGGPPDAALPRHWFRYWCLAATEEAAPRRLALRVTGPDPYVATAQAAAEAALALVAGRPPGGGFFTPATAPSLGEGLAERLRRVGWGFDVVEGGDEGLRAAIAAPPLRANDA